MTSLMVLKLHLNASIFFRSFSSMTYGIKTGVGYGC